MKLRLHDKNVTGKRNIWINQEDEEPYGIGQVLGKMLFGEEERHPERYIPLDVVRYTLIAELCQVEKIIENYLNRDIRG